MSPAFPEPLELRPMSDAEYSEFAEQHVAEYARQLQLAGELDPHDGLATVREALADLLADRLRSQGHTFSIATAVPSGRCVGWLWLSPPPEFLKTSAERCRWLSQITVAENMRGQGVGRALLHALEAQLQAQGIDDLWLRVFDWNIAARALYQSLGYELITKFPTDAHLRKHLIATGT